LLSQLNDGVVYNSIALFSQLLAKVCVNLAACTYTSMKKGIIRGRWGTVGLGA